MINEFLKKLNNKEYISTYLYNNIKENNRSLIPNNFNLETYNKNILEKDYLKYKSYFENMYVGIDNNIKLDKEQIEAILADEDYSLIIAGAGTGKTTTMASKVKYLVDIKKVDPSKIAVMSYTKKATKELESRILLDFKIPAHITTFHSLGMEYIREIFPDRKCYVVDIQEKNEIFTNFIKERVFKDKEKLSEIMNIFTSFHINKPWIFSKYFQENFDKYDTYDEFFTAYKKHKINEQPNLKEYLEKRIDRMINNEDYIITIKDEIVKSKGEAIIANYLFTNGIEYKYEKVYKEIMENKRTYKPDFTLNLNGEEIYVEYFGLSNYEEHQLNRYETERKRKEDYHKQHNTKFIKIDYIKGEKIEDTLQRELIKMGFTLKKKTYEEIYEQLLDNNPTSCIYPFKNFLYEIIDKIKYTEKRENYITLIKEYILNSSDDLKDTMINQFKIIDEFYHYYQEKLFKNTEYYGFDYSDMIYYADKYIKSMNTRTNLSFEYIIIDEYQDISELRYSFTKKISDVNHAKVVAVGDDWQSIFAFAGSKIKYIYNFEKYFENSKLLKITKTYRNSQELINYSGEFIMKNKDQIDKTLLSNKSITSPIKFILFKEKEEYKMLKKLILYIHKNKPNDKILILGRTNKIIEECFKESELKDDIDTKITFIGYEDIDIDGMTIHKSKGLTSDEVIIIGLDNNFPKPPFSDFWMSNIFKEKLEKESIPYAEERRLFYVALTRTKNNVYLLVNENPKRRSPFVNEIYNITKNNKIEEEVKQ
jgi:DNA helicase-4